MAKCEGCGKTTGLKRMLSDGSWVCADCIENGKAEKIEENIKKVNKLKVEQKQKMEEKKDFMDKYWKWMAFIMISLVLGVLFDTGNISVDASSGAWAAALTFVCLSIVEKIVTKPRKEFVIMGGCIVSGFVGAMAFTSNQHTAMGQPITWGQLLPIGIEGGLGGMVVGIVIAILEFLHKSELEKQEKEEEKKPEQS